MTSSTNIRLSAIHRKGRELYPDGLNSDGVCVESYHVPNKGQVESMIAGLSLRKAAVAVAYGSNIDITSGGQIVENWTDADGNAQSFTPDVGARALVYGQADPRDNGIYIVSGDGTWQRSFDADDPVELPTGSRVKVLHGEFAGQDFELAEDKPTFGVDAITFSRIGASSGQAIDISYDSTANSLITGANVQDALDTLDATLLSMDQHNTDERNALAQVVSDADTVLSDAINQVAADLAAEIVATNDEHTQMVADLAAEATARQTGDDQVLAALNAQRQHVGNTVIPSDGHIDIVLSLNVLPSSIEVYEVQNDGLMPIGELITRKILSDEGGVVQTLRLSNDHLNDITVQTVIKY